MNSTSTSTAPWDRRIGGLTPQDRACLLVELETATDQRERVRLALRAAESKAGACPSVDTDYWRRVEGHLSGALRLAWAR